MTQETEHLRAIAKIYREHWGQDVVNAGYIDWAADEIERLRTALKPFADEAGAYEGDVRDDLPLYAKNEDGDIEDCPLNIGHLRVARAALQQS